MLFFSHFAASLKLKYLFTLVIPNKKQTNKALFYYLWGLPAASSLSRSLGLGSLKRGDAAVATATFNFLFKIMSIFKSTNTYINTSFAAFPHKEATTPPKGLRAKGPLENGDYKSNIEILKPLVTTYLNLKSNTLKPEDKRFNQWLAGLIDGGGCFLLSKKGYASLEIVAHIRDKNFLYQIKQKFGGAVKLRTNLNHLRFRMHHKQGMLDIINAVNGEIRNPIRLLQLNKICEKYNILVLPPATLTYENA